MQVGRCWESVGFKGTSWSPASALGLAANGPRAGPPPRLCHRAMDFVIWKYFLLFSPVLYSTLLFLAKISPPALLRHTLHGGTGAAPEGGAGRWVSLHGDRQSWRLPRDLQDTWRRGEMTLPLPLSQAPIVQPEKNSTVKGTASYKSNAAGNTPGAPKGLQRVSSQLFRLGLIQKPGPLKGFFILGLKVLCFRQCRSQGVLPGPYICPGRILTRRWSKPRGDGTAVSPHWAQACGSATRVMN